MTTSAMPAEQPRATRPGRLWRNRSYMLLWSGQAISTIGTQVSTVAFPLLVLFLTHSPAQAGLMGAVRALPYLFFSLPAGALVDRWDRKRVMIVCDTGRAIAMGSIPVALALSHLSMVQLYIVSAVEGTLFVFFNIAEVACIAACRLQRATSRRQRAECRDRWHSRRWWGPRWAARSSACTRMCHSSPTPYRMPARS